MKENRKGIVYYQDEVAGIIEESEDGFTFTYDDDFFKKGEALSFSLPITKRKHQTKKLFPFFLGLLPEGWYHEIVLKKLKIDEKDDFGLLLATCQDNIGAVSIKKP